MIWIFSGVQMVLKRTNFYFFKNVKSGKLYKFFSVFLNTDTIPAKGLGSLSVKNLKFN